MKLWDIEILFKTKNIPVSINLAKLYELGTMNPNHFKSYKELSGIYPAIVNDNNFDEWVVFISEIENHPSFSLILPNILKDRINLFWKLANRYLPNQCHRQKTKHKILYF